MSSPVASSTMPLPSPFSTTTTVSTKFTPIAFNSLITAVRVPPVLTTSSTKRILSPSFKSLMYNLEVAYPVDFTISCSPGNPYCLLRMTTNGMSVSKDKAVAMWIPIASTPTILSILDKSNISSNTLAISFKTFGSIAGIPSLIPWTK